jgi:hypothetical protein
MCISYHSIDVTITTPTIFAIITFIKWIIVKYDKK